MPGGGVTARPTGGTSGQRSEWRGIKRLRKLVR